MDTNGDVIQCTYDLAPLLYTSTNISIQAVRNSGAIACPLFYAYKEIDWIKLGLLSKIIWDSLEKYVLPALAGLTGSQNNTSLGLDNGQSPIPD